MSIVRTSPIISGVLILVLGCMLAFTPVMSAQFFAWLVGFAFLIGAVVGFIVWNANKRAGISNGGSLFAAILSLIIALVCFFLPLFSAVILTWIVAWCIVVAGIMQIVMFARMKGTPHRVIGGISSVLVVLMGIIALAWPLLLVQFIGVAAIIQGISLIIIGAISKD